MRRNLNKKTYLINGFLESGKSEFIQYTLDQPYFQSKGKTLLILCEDGEIQYKRALLRRNHVVVERVEEEQMFTLALLNELDAKHNPDRILIEYNGMWSHKTIKFPDNWKMEQQITTIDATTFGAYYANMKPIIGDMIRKSELILFNRAEGVKDLVTFKRNLRMVNQQAEIVFEGTDSQISTILEEELPYDVHADVIEITDDTYGMWFFDMLENTDRYIGKCVEFVGCVLRKNGYSKEYFVPFRKVMTCCEDDITRLGFVCKYDSADQYKDNTWVKVRAVVAKEFWADYGEEGPILHATLVEETEVPRKEIL